MTQRLKLFLPLTVFLVIAAFFVWALRPGYNPSAMPSALIDKSFPAFTLMRLQDNTPVYRDSLLGDVNLVNVWATWCAACKYEHPVLNYLAEQGINIVGINYKDNTPEALKWLTTLGNPYQFNIVDGDGSLGVDLGVFGAPETYLVDTQGIIRYKHVGIVDMQVWNDILKPLYMEYSK